MLREGIKSAREICCGPEGQDPISILMEAARFLRQVAVATRHSQGDLDISKIPRTDLDFIRRFMVDASNIAYKAAEFAYPKLARVEHKGEIDTAVTVRQISHDDLARALEERGLPPAVFGIRKPPLIEQRPSSNGKGNGKDKAD
jgi:hypothetical protein